MDCSYEIRFDSLYAKPALRFPCDARGEVQLDALSERARESYFFARAVVGAQYAYPKVCRTSIS
jgi:hypothetical protein